MDFREPEWWKNSVIYQIYSLSFADGNGDGKGDLVGIAQRLDYLNDGNPDSQSSLGIDAIWMTPVNKSPMVDNGYDISDYYDICPVFGTLADFDALLEKAHQRGVKVIFDLVINHTSDRHDWFIESCSSRDNPKSDWYLWQDPNPNGEPPNNWRSYFGGSGWTFNEQRQQYYFHSFNKNQPDLNWRNPDVKQAVYDIIRFWLDKGVDGFRLDASSVYLQDKHFRNNPLKFEATDTVKYRNYHHLYTRDLPENHDIIREIRSIVERYDNCVLIGETFIDDTTIESNSFYGENLDELHLPCTFKFALNPWYPGFLQLEIQNKEMTTPPGAWPLYFTDNHDIPRHLSRWFECSLSENPDEVAKAAATLLLTVRGTPIIYYGQELGMFNNINIPPERASDRAVMDRDTDEPAPPPRDGARTPMQWDDSAQAGFSFGKDIQPWLPVHDNYAENNVEAQFKDKDSVLNFYRRLLQIRKKSDALQRGNWQNLIHYPYEHLAYLRETETETVLVLINYSGAKDLKTDKPIEQKRWEVLLSNRLETGEVVELPKVLEPFEVSILRACS